MVVAFCIFGQIFSRKAEKVDTIPEIMDSSALNISTDSPLNSTIMNATTSNGNSELGTLVLMVFYGVLCFLGLVGNSLVIYVILRYTKMKTVTNLYILNLSITDGFFLMGIPLIMTTAILKTWIFGDALCKIYYIVYSINMFTGAFTLLVMSGDRYMAVCYPISSMRFRTTFIARWACASTWIASFLVMFPVVLYARSTGNGPSRYTCTISWPKGQLQPSQAYICYTSVLGFVVPVFAICILYTLLIIRLKSTGPAVKSVEKRRSHRKITKLVTLIIVVYIFCWLPYWVFQFYLIFVPKASRTKFEIYLYQVLTFLSYTNSMLNPFLYAFTNGAFRDSFIAAFKCRPVVQSRGGRRRDSEVEMAVTANNNVNAVKKRATGTKIENTAANITEDRASPECDKIVPAHIDCSSDRELTPNEGTDANTNDPLVKQSSL